MQKRRYGSTDELLSIIGFGGIVVSNVTDADAERYVSEALDAGVNYFDVAPTYANAQQKLGTALKGRRDKVFLACKTEKRDAAQATKALEESLECLGTETLDLYQFHSVSTLADVDRIFAPGGAMQVMEKARRDGKIKYIGFSSHLEEAALRMLDLFAFDSLIFPVNWLAMHRTGMGERILKKAVGRGIAVTAIKAMAWTLWPASLPREERPYPKCWYKPLDDENLADMALRYTLSKPVMSAIPPGDIRLFRQALKTAADMKPLTQTELALLKQASQEEQPIFPA